MRLGARGRQQHGVRIHAKAVIGEPLPVSQVVLRLVPGAREVRNLILRDSGCVQALGGALVKRDGERLVWDMVGVVAASPGNQFASQPGVGIHLQHVNAGVRHLQRHDLIERPLPALARLVGQPGDQVDADFADPCLAQAADIVEGHGAGMQPSHGAGFLIDEGLHPQRDAIDPCPYQRGQYFLRERSGRNFHRDLGVRRNLKYRRYGRKESVQLIRRKHAGRAAAQIHRVENRIEPRSAFPGDPGRIRNLPLQVANVSVEQIAREDTRGKVAERTLGPAERHRKIQRGMDFGGQIRCPLA